MGAHAHGALTSKGSFARAKQAVKKSGFTRTLPCIPPFPVSEGNALKFHGEIRGRARDTFVRARSLYPCSRELVFHRPGHEIAALRSITEIREYPKIDMQLRSQYNITTHASVEKR